MVISRPIELQISELIENRQYFVLTERGELEEFEYLGLNDIHIIDGNYFTFLIASDRIFTK